MGLSNEPHNEPDVDWHCHSIWSDGQGTVPGLVKRATTRGVRLGISDHALRDNRRLRTPEQLSAYRDLLREHDVLAGVEISVGDLGDGVDLAAFDYVIASLHTVHVPAGVVSAVRYLNWRAGLYDSYGPSLAMGEREVYFDAWLRSLEATLQEWPVTVLGHFSLLPDHANAGGVYVLGEEAVPDATAAAWLDATIMLCLQHNVAIELNSKSRVPPQSFVQRALELGATFSLGSDAHQVSRAGDLSYGRQLVRRLQIPAQRVLRAPQQSRGAVSSAPAASSSAS